MKIIIQLCIGLVCMCQTIQSQDLIRYTKDGLYGFADLDGNIVIDVQYEEVTEFDLPLILSRKNYGSDRVIPSPLAHVKKDGLWSVINKKGEPILPTTSKDKFSIVWLVYKYMYWSHMDYLNRLSAVKIKNMTDGTWRIFYLENEEMGKAIYQDWIRRPRPKGENNYIDFCDTYGTRPPRPDNVDRYFVASRRHVDTPLERLYECGSYNYHLPSGPPGAEPSYDLINTLDGTIEIKGSKSISKVCPNIYLYTNSEDNKTIYNGDTKSSVNLAYPLLNVNVKESLSEVQSKGRLTRKMDYEIDYYIVGRPTAKGLLDKNLNLVLDTLYSHIGICENYFITSQNISSSDDRKILLFDNNRVPIEIPEVKSLRYIPNDSFIAQLKTGKYVLLDRGGRLVDDQEYDMLTTSRQTSSRLMYKYKQGEIAGLRDLKGENIFSYPCEEVTSFYNDADTGDKYFLVKSKRLFGLVKADGNVLYPMKYKNISMLNVEAGLLTITNEDYLLAVVDLEENVLIPFKYDRIRIDKVSIPGTHTSEKQIVCFNNKEEAIRYDLDMNVVQKSVSKGKREPMFEIEGINVKKGSSKSTAIVDVGGNMISDSIYYGVRHYPVGKDYIVTGLVDRDGTVDIFNSKGKQIAKRGAILKPASIVNGKMKNVVYAKELNAVIVTEGETQALVNLDGEYLTPSGRYKKISCSHEYIVTTRAQDDLLFRKLYDAKLNPLTKEYAELKFIKECGKICYMLAAEAGFVKAGEPPTIKYGIIGLDGKVKIPFEYDEGRVANYGVSLTKIEKGERDSEYYDLSLVLKQEGPYDYFIGKDYKTKTIDAIKGDNYIWIKQDGTVKEVPMIYPVSNSEMVVKKMGNKAHLCDSEGNTIYSEYLEKGVFNSITVTQLSEDCFVFQRPGLLYLLSQKGKILAQLDCDTYLSEVSARYDAYLRQYIQDPLLYEEYKELLHKKLLKITHDDVVYYYNFEKLISFKE